MWYLLWVLFRKIIGISCDRNTDIPLELKYVKSRVKSLYKIDIHIHSQYILLRSSMKLNCFNSQQGMTELLYTSKGLAVTLVIID